MTRARDLSRIANAAALTIDTNNNVGIGSTTPDSKLDVGGVVRASGGFNIGISSAGTVVTSGPIKTLNFVGSGNTFSLNGTSVDVSISGGGGSSVFTVLSRSGLGITVSAPSGTLTIVGRASNISVPV